MNYISGPFRSSLAKPINLSSPCVNLAAEETEEPARSAQECMMSCSDHPGCTFFRFNQETKICYKFIYHGSVSSPSTGVISTNLTGIYQSV